MRHGRLLSAIYLFEAPLAVACGEVGLVDADGRPMITAHRFRHTVGTELAQGGARLHRIMKMLGHTSTGMTLVYAHLSDEVLREDYQKVLGHGAVIAGPLAAQLRAGAMPQASIDSPKTTFFRTEIELGHCLRLPQEGPCECDLHLTYAKFVTTREYAPRLRARRRRELALIDEAATQGWPREVERHRGVVQRIEQLLLDLGEPVADGDKDSCGWTQGKARGACPTAAQRDQRIEHVSRFSDHSCISRYGNDALGKGLLLLVAKNPTMRAIIGNPDYEQDNRWATLWPKTLMFGQKIG